MAKSAYIHIPFCKSKCKYCSFVSYTDCSKNDRDSYIVSLLDEIDYYYKGETLETIYFGGGTPSLLPVDIFKQILNKFSFNADTEITVEINPETVDFSYITSLRNIGVNRVSIGIQSFDDNILKNIGRIHSSKKAIECVNLFKNAGFDNISVDFIYGLPEQTLENFLYDITKAISLNVEHISLYGLKIEEGCRFYKNNPRNLPDDDMQAEMYLAAIQLLESNGFKHYEISNFCRSGKYSHHNLNYWNCGEYYGFGAAAHGYVDGVRYANFFEIQEYKNMYKDKFSKHKLSKKEQLEEMIFLGLRKAAGINYNQINLKFGIDFEKEYESVVQKYLKTGHLKKTDCGCCFSNEGFLLSNIILSDFISL